MKRISIIPVSEKQVKVISIIDQKQIESIKIIHVDDGERLIEKLLDHGFTRVDTKFRAIVFAKP
jgi:hypothetical protein